MNAVSVVLHSAGSITVSAWALGSAVAMHGGIDCFTTDETL